MEVNVIQTLGVEMVRSVVTAVYVVNIVFFLDLIQVTTETFERRMSASVFIFCRIDKGGIHDFLLAFMLVKALSQRDLLVRDRN